VKDFWKGGKMDEENPEPVTEKKTVHRRLPRADSEEKGLKRDEEELLEEFHKLQKKDKWWIMLFKCFFFPCYCNSKYCFRCFSNMKTMQSIVLLAILVMVYGYVVLINDVIAHSYEAREARGLPGRAGHGIHGTPHVIEQTQRFYS
jgi:hypothetical protein